MSGLQPMVLMMAGGTGGHVYPALAVASELMARGYRVEWVGTARGLEQRVVPGAGILLHHLAVRGVRGKGLLEKLLALASLFVAALQALWLVLRRAPACVVGMGGYAAGPAGVAAWLLRKPLLVHEQNAVAGTTNRMLAPLATRILAGFPGAFAAGREYTVTGNPVRRELLVERDQYRYDYAGGRPLRLLVLGGSLGAQPINELMPAVVQALNAQQLSSESWHPLELWHQTGAAHIDSVRELYRTHNQNDVQVVPFIEDMQAAYAWADLVLCRAGALTLAELAVVGLPGILVPLPHAIDDHQTANARALTATGGALLVPQSELDVSSLAALLADLQAQPERLQQMAAASFAAATPSASQDVCDMCEEMMHV